MTSSEILLEILKKQDIKHFLYLPCDRVKSFLFFLENQRENLPFSLISLTREEEGIGISFGLNLGKEKNVLFIQSSGFGNIIGALITLTKTYNFPLPILVSLRGLYKEKIYPQILMGKALLDILKALKIDHVFIENKKDLEKIEKLIESSYKERKIKVALILPSVFEGENYKNSIFEKDRCFEKEILYKKKVCTPDMTRYEFFKEFLGILKSYKEKRKIKKLLSSYKNFVFFVNIGFPSREFYYAQKEIKTSFPSFYMLGSLGLVSSIAFGFSITHLGKQYKVISLDGDGSLLMNTGTLATINAFGKENLSIYCIDNGSWGSTGDQEIYTFDKVDLELVAKGVGFKYTSFINYKKDLYLLFEEKNLLNKSFNHILVKPGNEKVPTIEKSPSEIIKDFYDALLVV